jgi:hypothetical protein
MRLSFYWFNKKLTLVPSLLLLALLPGCATTIPQMPINPTVGSLLPKDEALFYLQSLPKVPQEEEFYCKFDEASVTYGHQTLPYSNLVVVYPANWKLDFVYLGGFYDAGRDDQGFAYGQECRAVQGELPEDKATLDRAAEALLSLGASPDKGLF